MKSATCKATTKTKTKQKKISKPFYGRAFYYSGNIVHIQDYIERNKPSRVCKVKIYVEKLSKSERELWVN